MRSYASSLIQGTDEMILKRDAAFIEICILRASSRFNSLLQCVDLHHQDKVSSATQSVNFEIKRVFRDFGEAACETRALVDRFWRTMVLKRAGIIS
jgi:hypothetical protein